MNEGITRLVFKVGNHVIKIPNFKHSHLHFLNGCYANWSERNYCKMFKDIPEFLHKVAPSLWCSWFGLVQIQAYCKPLDREITREELVYFKDVRKGERKSTNFGYYNGKVVCFDYP